MTSQRQQARRPWYEWYRDPANLHLNLNNPQDRRVSVLKELDEMPRFDWKIVFVASLGFLIDAYDIFALNFVVPMLAFVYPNEITLGRTVKATQSVTLVGIFIGQVVFGISADIIGRKPTYGLTLWLTILGTIALALTSSGFNNSMSFSGSVIAWRLIMGIGIGSDYPLSAAITAEFAPSRYRSQMIATVFFMQPIGQACATVIALICTGAFKSHLDLNCNAADTACLATQARALDRLWRLIVGLGAVPAALALFFRLTIPESIRYTMDVQRNLARAQYDAFWHTQNNSHAAMTGANENTIQLNHLNQPNGLQTVQIQHGPLGVNFQHPNGNAIPPVAAAPAGGIPASDADSDDGRSAIVESDEAPGIPSFGTYFTGFTSFLFKHGGWRPLLGATMNWLLLDYAFYGIGMSSLNFAAFVWNGGRIMQVPIYETLIENGRNSIVLVSIGASAGGLLMIAFVSRFQMRTIQFCGFILLAVIMILAGAPFESALEHHAKAWLMICFIASQVFFNFGPNSTTFIIPAEIFPTRYRCSCHGIAAGLGKIGSLLGQIFVSFVQFDHTTVPYGSVRPPTTGRDQEFQPKKARATGFTLLTFMPFMLLGAFFTYYFTPPTQYEGGEALSLEELQEKLYGEKVDWIGKRNLGKAPVDNDDDDP